MEERERRATGNIVPDLIVSRGNPGQLAAIRRARRRDEAPRLDPLPETLPRPDGPLELVEAIQIAPLPVRVDLDVPKLVDRGPRAPTRREILEERRGGRRRWRWRVLRK